MHPTKLNRLTYYWHMIIISFIQTILWNMIFLLFFWLRDITAAFKQRLASERWNGTDGLGSERVNCTLLVWKTRVAPRNLSQGTTIACYDAYNGGLRVHEIVYCRLKVLGGLEEPWL